MSLDEMRKLDALKTYKELEAAKARIEQLEAKIKSLRQIGGELRDRYEPFARHIIEKEIIKDWDRLN